MVAMLISSIFEACYFCKTELLVVSYGYAQILKHNLSPHAFFLVLSFCADKLSVGMIDKFKKREHSIKYPSPLLKMKLLLSPLCTHMCKGCSCVSICFVWFVRVPRFQSTHIALVDV